MRSSILPRLLTTLLPMLVLVACAPGGVRPRSELTSAAPEAAHCVLRTLEDGQEICLSSAPLSGGDTATSRAALSEDVAVEDLIDPDDIDALPSRVDLRESLAGCLEVRNQGECGWCAGHTGAEVLDALACAEGCGPARSSVPHLWSVGRDGPIGDCGPGMSLTTALRSATEDPLVPESVWPFTGGRRGMESTRPSEAQLAMQGRYRADDAVIIRDQLPGSGPTPSQLRRIRAALASGRAVGVTSGVCWSQGWGAPDFGRELIDAPTGTCASTPDGYHAWVLVGYDDATGEYVGLNSWGTSWGIGGYFRMTRAFVERQISGAGYLTELDREAAQCTTETTPSCSDVTDCAQCTQSTGCIFCDGRCVSANATRTGAADGSSCMNRIEHAAWCPAPTGACSAHHDCGSCAADDGCAWCGRSNRCVGWPEQALACNGERVATEADQCNDATRACEQQTDCASCQAMPGCGWCRTAERNIHASGAAPCVGGDSEHSDRASCDSAWAPVGTMCPASPDAGMPDATAPSTTAPDAGMCSPAGESCTSDTCCGSLVCRGGGCCALPSSPCETAADCCDGVACEGGTCQCIPTGAPCSDTVLCCGSNVCRAGTCQAP